MNNYKEDGDNIPFHLKLIFGLILFLLLVSAAFFVYKFYLTFNGEIFPSNHRSDWGTLGDFFGGILNPIFGFASFLALLATIFYQSKELNASTKELRNSATALTAQNKAIELQSFEQTFFSWLNTYRSVLSTIEENHAYKETLIISNGKPLLFKWWAENFNSRVIVMYIRNSNHCHFPQSILIKSLTISDDKDIENFLFDTAYNFPQETTNLILQMWEELYKAKEFQLDSLFRVLYRLLIWIDSQQNNRLSPAQKWLYISIIRGQLSWIEMAYLYMNGLTKVGEKFKLIIEKYALFDNLTFNSDASLQVLKFYCTAPQAYKEVAYSSELAREKLGLPRSSEETLALATATPLQHAE